MATAEPTQKSMRDFIIIFIGQMLSILGSSLGTHRRGALLRAVDSEHGHLRRPLVAGDQNGDAPNEQAREGQTFSMRTAHFL